MDWANFEYGRFHCQFHGYLDGSVKLSSQQYKPPGLALLKWLPKYLPAFLGLKSYHIFYLRSHWLKKYDKTLAIPYFLVPFKEQFLWINLSQMPIFLFNFYWQSSNKKNDDIMCPFLLAPRLSYVALVAYVTHSRVIKHLYSVGNVAEQFQALQQTYFYSRRILPSFLLICQAHSTRICSISCSLLECCKCI